MTENHLLKDKVLIFLELRKELILSKVELVHRLDEQSLKATLLLNGAALVALASSLDGLLSHGCNLAFIKVAFAAYLIGLVLSAVVFAISTSVISNAPDHFYNEFMQLLDHQKKIEDLTGYGFTKRGRVIYALLNLGSFISFMIGSVYMVRAI